MENNMQFARKSFEKICVNSTGTLESITNVFYCKSILSKTFEHRNVLLKRTYSVFQIHYRTKPSKFPGYTLATTLSRDLV